MGISSAARRGKANRTSHSTSTATTYPKLRKKGGKKIFELQPDVEWDKGRAELWLTEALGLNHAGVVSSAALSQPRAAAPRDT